MEHETDERGDTGADKRQETKAAAGTGTTVVARTALGRALGEFVRAGVRFARTFARTHAAARALATYAASRRFAFAARAASA